MIAQSSLNIWHFHDHSNVEHHPDNTFSKQKVMFYIYSDFNTTSYIAQIISMSLYSMLVLGWLLLVASQN